MIDPRLHHRKEIQAQIWVEPSAEQWLWVRLFPRWFGPTAEDEQGLPGWFGRFFVVPSTNLTNFSLRYQSYLNDIFHLSPISRATHFILMPLITALFFAALGKAHVLGAVLVAAWWLTWALRERLPLWGACAVAWVALLDVGAATFVASGRSPWPWILLFGALQAGSHAAESGLPPRVNGTARWMPVVDFFLQPPTWGLRFTRLLRAVETAVYGTFDEIIASPRLAPIQLLEVLWACGYAPKLRAEWKDSSRRAIATGNPALDYIGEGGGTSLRWVERS